MNQAKLPVAIRGRFRRSVNITHDFSDGLDGYILTAKAKELLYRIAESLEGGTSQRAWSMFGAYGGGKSTCALYIAKLFSGNKMAHKLLQEADPVLAGFFQNYQTTQFCPVLIVGGREPLSSSLLSGLASSLSAFAVNLPQKKRKNLNTTISDIKKSLAENNIVDGVVLSFYQRAASEVSAVTGGGLLVIVDELGKLLEYTAHHSERSDLYLLQLLAERAARTGNSGDFSAPIILLTILHQAFERYAEHLTLREQEEWRKVQGRFEDFAFLESFDETLRLISNAIEVDTDVNYSVGQDKIVENLISHTSLPQYFDLDKVKYYLQSALPLDPSVSLIIGPLFKKLAQSERSLFAFLSSGEPDSFLEVMTREIAKQSIHSKKGKGYTQLPIYRLDNLYDYLIGALGGTLFYKGITRLWAETEAALAKLENPSELSIRLIKQIAILSYAGSYVGLKSTLHVLNCTCSASSKKTKEALELLCKKRVITYRSFNKEYHIWQGSDFDLDEKLAEARRHVSLRAPIADLIQKFLPPSPITARRHSYRTGTNRIFEVMYASDTTWARLSEKTIGRSDGRIIYVFPERSDEVGSLFELLQKQDDDSLLLYAVPRGIEKLGQVVRDLTCLEWVRKNSDELKGDAVARKELDQRIADLKGYIQSHIATLLVSDREHGHSCIWFNQGQTFEFVNERGLQEKLSELCDQVFSKAPEIWNELLNRRKPSSNAIRALKLLLKAVVESPSKDVLGIEGTPAEYGLYASILKVTGMHREIQGEWSFAPPYDNRKGCVAVWEAISGYFKNAQGKRVSVQTIYDSLEQPPYGVRKGLIPIFIFAYYKHFEDDIACFEEGVFLAELSFAEIERLLKRPDRFEFQLVEIDNTRAEVLDNLAPLLGLPENSRTPLPFVIRLLQRTRELTPYACRTSHLTSSTIAVREALLRAEEPTTLLFNDLPEACGLTSFLADTRSKAEIELFVERLKLALRELGDVYTQLISRIASHFQKAFGLHSSDVDVCRRELASRSQPLLRHATHPGLKAFLVRSTEEIIDTQSWYASLAALLAKRTPAQWKDPDFNVFLSALTEIARRFRTLEPLVFDYSESNAQGNSEETDRHPSVKRLRIGITALDTQEQEAVVCVHVEDEPIVEDLIEKLKKSLSESRGSKNSELKLAALAQLAQTLLVERESSFETDQIL